MYKRSGGFYSYQFSIHSFSIQHMQNVFLTIFVVQHDSVSTLRNNNARYTETYWKEQYFSDIFVEEYVSEILINDTDLLVS